MWRFLFKVPLRIIVIQNCLMNFRKVVAIFLLPFLCSTICKAQVVEDTLQNAAVSDTIVSAVPLNGIKKVGYDTALKSKITFQPNPKKSALYSAILPGSGQLYNRQYWKIPVVYAGVAASVYFLIDNSENYRRYRRAYISRINNPFYQDEFSGIRSMQDLQTLQNYHKKYLDMTILLTAVGYTLQVMDALAYAHLRNFDISGSISMKVQPVAMPNGYPGLGLVMNFK